MTLRRLARFAAALFVAGALAACTMTPPDTSAADVAALRKADEDWSAAARSRSAPAWIAFYGPDAMVLPPNGKAATTEADIAKAIKGLMALPDLSMSWRPVKVEISKSGDLGYIQGTYDLSFTGPKRRKVSDHGKYIEVWRKQPDGSWKCIVDIWNSDLPA
jgi:ketosteroid isomerase-like protein